MQNREICMESNVSEHQNDRLIGLVSLMRMAVSGVDLAPLGAQLIERAAKFPNTANALMDLSTVLQLRGERDLAMEIQAQALQIQQIYLPPTRRTGKGNSAIRVLAIMGAGDLMANSPIEFLVEEKDIVLNMLYVTNKLPDILPEHDVLFVAIAESKQNIALLNNIREDIEHWPRPVLNRPERIVMLSRDNNARLLKSAPGIEMPTTARISREELERVGRGELAMTDILDDGDFPVIVRPVDSHAGKGLEKLEEANAIAGYLQGMADNEFYVSRFVDYRDKDGMFRKYRIVLIEGRPFACHMGISEHWMIHYLNAGMADCIWKREEEAQFMADFDNDFAVRHAPAFQAINERIGLDYLGIDCAQTREGKLLIFEVDSCMIIHALDSVEVFPYKQPQMRKVFEAFYQMLSLASESI